MTVVKDQKDHFTMSRLSQAENRGQVTISEAKNRWKCQTYLSFISKICWKTIGYIYIYIYDLTHNSYFSSSYLNYSTYYLHKNAMFSCAILNRKKRNKDNFNRTLSLHFWQEENFRCSYLLYMVSYFIMESLQYWIASCSSYCI